MYVCVLCVCLVPIRGQKRHRILWKQSYRCCKVPCGYWELNLDHQVESGIFTAIEHTLIRSGIHRSCWFLISEFRKIKMQSKLFIVLKISQDWRDGSEWLEALTV